MKKLIRSVHKKIPDNIYLPQQKLNTIDAQSNLSEYKWPFFKNNRFDYALQKYMYSFKNIYSENINVGSLCFITGPTKCGKSWYLRYNMRKFQNS